MEEERFWRMEFKRIIFVRYKKNITKITRVIFQATGDNTDRTFMYK